LESSAEASTLVSITTWYMGCYQHTDGGIREHALLP
jgi:hypothetical protein